MSINSVDELWNRIYDDCRQNERITDVGLKTWIIDLKPTFNEDGSLTLITNNEYKKKTIDSYYKDILEASCEAVSGLPMKINIVVREDEAENAKPEGDFEKGYTFSNFVVGSSNKFAHAAAMAVAENPSSNVYNPLFIYGNSGVGKTHLMLAIKNSIEKDFPDKKTLFLRGEQFTNELVQAIRTQTTDLFRERFRSVDVLLMDDIHFIAGKDYAQEEFFNTFNALYPEKQIVVTSDRPPKEIKTLEERIRSRFESGILADMSPPDFETRMGILKNKADQLGLEVSDEILYYIAEQIKSNIRQLEGITKKLHAMCVFGEQKPTIALAQTAIKDILTDVQPLHVTVDRIVDEVSRTTGVSVDDIMSKKHTANVSDARKMCFYIIREVTDMSYKNIGSKFNRDHSTVMYNIEKMEERIKTDSTLNSQVSDIISNIKDYR